MLTPQCQWLVSTHPSVQWQVYSVHVVYRLHQDRLAQSGVDTERVKREVLVCHTVREK